MRKPIIIWKDAFTVKMKNRRILARRLENGDWRFMFTALHTGKVKKKHFDTVKSRGNKHVCITRLQLSNEATENIVAGYLHFANAHKLPINVIEIF
jgi:hypothetical protein